MSPSMSVIKIGIADDHMLFRQGVVQLLKRDALFKVIMEADSNTQLLEQLELQMPDIVLMDVEMPGTDGIDGCKEILKKYPQVKIIALSMHTADNFIFHMMKAGARSYLPKDIDQGTLKEVIKTVYLNGFHFTEAITTAILRGAKAESYQKNTLIYNQSPLTKREKEILELVCKGMTNNDIAEKLFISIRTVEGHRKKLLEKTGTSNSVSLAVYALKTGLLE
jgi:DNA-binding NarL/FixJ family response regulator